MLKWDNYKKMTTADKEEWNYRFKDRIEYRGAPNPFTNILLISMSFSVMLFTYFLTMKEYVDTALAFTDVYILSMSVAVCMLIVWVLQIVVDILYLIYWNYKANKWLKLKGYK